MTGAYRIGCDVGGTFTDLCLVEAESGQSTLVKIPTTVGEEATAVVAAARLALEQAGLGPEAIAGFAHGTTVATNAVLERKGARTALVVTAGFRDLMLIARQMRPHLYDPRARRAPPLVPRHLTYEVPEHIGPDGSVQHRLDEDAVHAIAGALAAAGVQSVAVVLLHSYANASHEQRVRDLLTAALPDLDISLSAEVLPRPGEYERASTTVMNAYLMPPLRSYLGKLCDGLAEMGLQRAPTIMQSNGGTMTAATAGAAKSVHTCLSGPAAGLVGAAAFAKAAGFANVVTVDMGGTSFDVGLIRDGEILTRFEGDIAGFPLWVPMFDIVTLGAGGGSLARAEAGLLRVGPESAGATPGPAAYGKGGTRPTVTDANVVLGRLRHGRRLGGDIVIDRERACRAVADHIGAPLGLDEAAAADGIRRIVNAAMVRGIRRMTVERGLDPRGFALMAFGGAGPLHALDLAAQLSMDTIIIPPSPGLLCAAGLLLAPWRHDETMSLGTIVAGLDGESLRGKVTGLAQRAQEQARADGIDPLAIELETGLDLRYLGQGHEIAVPFDGTDISAAVAIFHESHRTAFGYDRPHQQVEVMTLRLMARAAPPVTRLPVPSFEAGDPVIGSTEVIMAGRRQQVDIVERRRLKPGTELHGPVLIEQPDTTMLVEDQSVVIDTHGNLLITVNR